MNGGPTHSVPQDPADRPVSRVAIEASNCHYFSTYCLHGFHVDHPDTPCRKACMFCHAPCRCDCHRPTP